MNTVVDRDKNSRPSHHAFSVVSRSIHTNVCSLNSVLRGPEAQTDILIPSPATLSLALALAGLRLVVEEDMRLLLVSALALDSELGGHLDGSVCVDLKMCCGLEVGGV